MVHLHDGILCNRKKERAPTRYNGMDGTGEHCAKWNTPGGERQIPRDLTCKWDLINKTNKWNRTRDIEIKNKLTTTREGKGVMGGKGEMWSTNMFKRHRDKTKGG